ncbi:MAG TPA: hypothetical protein VLB76_18625 [Thermoanaerobaculia bacterium]|jgi:hypothetical protein|nr:hypothetical protein [Thermoanaerobaculia bacterium]
MNEPSLEPILAYLREHSWHYSLAALRERLLQDGQDPATVEWAIAMFKEPPTPPAPGQRVSPWVFLIATFNAVLATVLTMTLGGSPSEQQYWIFGPVAFAFMICLGEFFIVILLTIPRETRHLSGVLLQGIGLFAGVAVIVLGGLCFMGPP